MNRNQPDPAIPPPPAKPTCACMTVVELAALVGKGVPETRNAIRRGELPGYVVGQSYVVPREMVRRFLAGEPTIVHQPTIDATAREWVKQLTGEMPAHPFLRRRLIEAALGDDAEIDETEAA